MSDSATDWVAEKISAGDELELVDHMSDGLLFVKAKDHDPFPVAVTGVKDVVRREHVALVFSGETKPEFLVNVPSKALWSGAAIALIHGAPAAFGTLGELSRAARLEEVCAYRNKSREFFERAIQQHRNVQDVSLVYDHVFEAHRLNGKNLKIALIDAYNMSSEDVRNACDRFGEFDIVVKMSSYGSVTHAAAETAASLGAEALTFKGLMQRLER